MKWNITRCSTSEMNTFVLFGTQASVAGDRIKQWGGDIGGNEDDEERTIYKTVC